FAGSLRTKRPATSSVLTLQLALHFVRLVAPSSMADKLIARLRAAIRVRHYSIRTERAYVDWVKRFVRFNELRHPAELGIEHVSAFLTSLAVDANVAASTQNQALNALVFLYAEVLAKPLPRIDGVVRATLPKRLPVVLTEDEVV